MEPLELDPPEIGRWYKTPSEALFNVVAIEAGAEEGGGTIEIQHFDGSIEEIDRAEWAALLARPVAEPEDCSGALDMGAEADPDAGIGESGGDDWIDPLSIVDHL